MSRTLAKASPKSELTWAVICMSGGETSFAEWCATELEAYAFLEALHDSAARDEDEDTAYYVMHLRHKLVRS